MFVRPVVVAEYRLCPTHASIFALSVKLTVSLTSGRGGSAGGKFRISLALPVGAVINCADNTGKFTLRRLCVCLTFDSRE